MKTSFAVIMALLGVFGSQDVQGTELVMQDPEQPSMLAEQTNAPKNNAKADVKKPTGGKKAAKAPVKGKNMAGDDKEKDELDNIPDVTADDYKDPTLKPFYIVLKAKGTKKVFMSKEKIGIDRVAKIKENPHPRNSVFLYDKRTMTIRLQSERNFALGNKMDKGLKPGHQAVFRRIMDGKVTEDQVLNFAKGIQNKAKKCLDVQGDVKDMASLQWWNCTPGKLSQKFAKEEKNKEKTEVDFNRSRFQIKVEASGNRHIYLSKEKNGSEFVLKLGKKNDWRSWFIMDKKTGSIRLYTQPHLAISNLAGKNVKPGAPLVMRPFDSKDGSQQIEVNGHRIQNAKSKRCLSTANNQNKDNVGLNFWPCNGKDTQKWARVAVKGNYEELCKDVVKNGGRYRICPGKAEKFLGKHCVRHVEQKKGKEVLVKKCGKETWEIAKCHRYQQKGQTFRKCGADHLEILKSADTQNPEDEFDELEQGGEN